jgi:hypothetical protein
MKRAFIALGTVVVLGTVYLAWTWLQRHDATARMNRRISVHRPAERFDDSKAVKITQFYARAAEMTDAERNLVCYGVRNAKAVRLDPPVEVLSPALTRCFWVEPKQDTTYTLVAEGFDGSQESVSFQVQVGPAPPHIQFVAVSHAEIRRGEPITVCYGVDHASRVRLEPMGFSLPAIEKNCTRFYPPRTLNYTLTALDSGGRSDREKFTVKVK